MGNTPKYVNFGWFNHGPSKPTDPLLDAYVSQKLWEQVQRLWRWTKAYFRNWFWTFPASYFLMALLNPSSFGQWVVFVIVTAACIYLRTKVFKKKVVVPPTEEEREIQRYTLDWPRVAKNAGLTQSGGAEGLGYYKAYRHLATQNNVVQKLDELATGDDGQTVVPELLKVEPVPLGYMHTVSLLPGQTVETYSRSADVMAALWLVAEVRVVPGVPGQVEITPVVKDPMAGIEPITSETNGSYSASVHEVQIGLLEDGTEWSFPLGVHSIVAGNSGGGKSVCYRALLSQMAKVPEVQIVGIDLKRGIELKSWRPRLATTATNMTDALDALETVWEIAEQRLDFLEERGLTDMKDYGFSESMPRIVVLIDEASELFAVGEPDRELAKQGKEAIALVSKMLRLVRAAGITIIMATQRPSTEVIPSGIRELTQNRVAFRMMNSSGAVMALGELPDNSISPVDIPEAKKGRAVVTDDQGRYSFAQCRFISPDDAKTIAQTNAVHATDLSNLAIAGQMPDTDERMLEGEVNE